MWQLRNNSGRFLVSIGEEGVVLAYLLDGKVQHKLFVRKIDEKDTEKLFEIFAKDKQAMVSIYIDTLDQAYILKSLPGVNSIAINKVAKKQLDREVPEGYLKALLQVGRSNIARKDWLYVFISTAFEGKIKTWIDYFIQFPNVIEGIYFLPVEVGAVMDRLHRKKLAEGPLKEKLLNQLRGLFQQNTTSTIGNWSLFIAQHKSGGFRQIVFQGNKVIFTRLLDNINDPNPQVVAGNIEQEIVNALEYLSRIAPGSSIGEVIVHIAIASDISKMIRKNKLQTKQINIYTPYELAKELDCSTSVGEKDRFSDPLLLAAIAKYGQNIIKLHTPLTKKVYNFTRTVNVIAQGMKALAPIILLIALYLGIRGISYTQTANAIQSTIEVQKQQLDARRQLHDQEVAKVPDIKKIYEIVEFHNYFKAEGGDKIFGIINSLARIMPTYMAIKKISWKYKDPRYFKKREAANGSPLTSQEQEENFEVILNLSFVHNGNYEDLQGNYNKYVESLKKSFEKCTIRVSKLPADIAFSDAMGTVEIIANITFSQPYERER
jgi:hypothetical protein